MRVRLLLVAAMLALGATGCGSTDGLDDRRDLPVIRDPDVLAAPVQPLPAERPAPTRKTTGNPGRNPETLPPVRSTTARPAPTATREVKPAPARTRVWRRPVPPPAKAYPRPAASSAEPAPPLLREPEPVPVSPSPATEHEPEPEPEPELSTPPEPAAPQATFRTTRERPWMRPGDRVRVTVNGYPPGSRVDVLVTGADATYSTSFTTDDLGHATARWRIPGEAASGTYAVTLDPAPPDCDPCALFEVGR
ncbi:hypothetical protein [Actinoplanes sp. NPDC051851]|uniref:hypothetical protein n=1 Tax=Actinoplanes sp. NPDC051851 TaxID=3154753 RepID=UPI0034261652